MMITVRSLNVLFSDVPVDVVVVVFLYSLIIMVDFVQCREIFVFFRASVIISVYMIASNAARLSAGRLLAKPGSLTLELTRFCESVELVYVSRISHCSVTTCLEANNSTL